MKKKKKNNILSYRTISYQQIKKIVDIKKKDNELKFNKWFSFDYKISESEQKFLKKLIKKNKLFLSSYNEAKLAFRFISRILNEVDFDTEKFTDWYESWLRGELNGVKFSGRPDFMVAEGETEPEKPYFFISEFKQSIAGNNPEYQLLAEMLVAMEENETKTLRGCFIIADIWRFLILEKLETGNYEYFVSQSFDCLDIDKLKQIYINLQAVKFLYCKD